MTRDLAMRRADDESDDEISLSADGNTVSSWLLCRTGPHRFALPMPQVIETMRMLPIQPIASAPAPVRGLCIIRAEPVLVIDTALLFGDVPGRCDRLITVRTGERTIALAAGAVLAVTAFPWRELAPLPPLLEDDGAIAAIMTRDRDLVFLLHAARSLPDDFAADIRAGSAGS